MIMYTIELNIKAVSDKLIEAMKVIGKNNDFEVFYHGSDQLVFSSDRGLNITKLIDELSNVCSVYGVDYVDLLI